MDQTKEWPIKIRRVTITDKKTGTKYIEERQYQYDPIKKYNRVISSRRVGEKILKNSPEVVRCRPKKKSSSASSELEAVRVRSGATDLLSYVGKISGIDAAVRAAYPNGAPGRNFFPLRSTSLRRGRRFTTSKHGSASTIFRMRKGFPKTPATTSLRSSV